MNYIHCGKKVQEYIQLTSKSIILPTSLINDKDFQLMCPNYIIFYNNFLTYMNNSKINTEKHKCFPLKSALIFVSPTLTLVLRIHIM